MKSIIETFCCGCAVYQEDIGGKVEWGVRRCEAHWASGMLPKEAEEYFGVEREAVP